MILLLNKAQRAIGLLRAHFGDIKREAQKDPFHVLINGILSQNTKDTNSSKAMKQLWEKASTPREILELSDSMLQKLIRSSGFYVLKAKYIKEASKVILEKYDGNVPTSRDELMELPGVGPKTADIVFSYGFNKAAIAIDTHVYRTSKRLGLAGDTDSHEKVKRQLEQHINQNDWNFADEALVMIGKNYCKSRNPLCSQCPLVKVCNFKKN